MRFYINLLTVEKYVIKKWVVNLINIENILVEMEQYAKEKRICIIRPDTRSFLKDLCVKLNPKTILEVGTAIGYSASTMLLSCDANITCCEASAPNIVLAKQNFERLHLTDRVNIIEGDCLKTLPIINEIIYSDKVQTLENNIKNQQNNINAKNGITGSLLSNENSDKDKLSGSLLSNGDFNQNIAITLPKAKVMSQTFDEQIKSYEKLIELKGQKFDLIFLDGPKGLYPEILKLLLPLLSKRGIFVADNVLFRGMVSGKNRITEPRFEKTVKALQQFIYELKKDSRLDFELLEIGDGLAVASWKK